MEMEELGDTFSADHFFDLAMRRMDRVTYEDLESAFHAIGSIITEHDDYDDSEDIEIFTAYTTQMAEEMAKLHSSETPRIAVAMRQLGYMMMNFADIVRNTIRSASSQDPLPDEFAEALIMVLTAINTSNESEIEQAQRDTRKAKLKVVQH